MSNGDDLGEPSLWVLRESKRRYHWLKKEERQKLVDDPSAFLQCYLEVPFLRPGFAWQVYEGTRDHSSCGESTVVHRCVERREDEAECEVDDGAWERARGGERALWFYSGQQSALALASGSLLMELLENIPDELVREALRVLSNKSTYDLSEHHPNSLLYLRRLRGVGGEDLKRLEALWARYVEYGRSVRRFPVRMGSFLLNVRAGSRCL